VEGVPPTRDAVTVRVAGVQLSRAGNVTVAVLFVA
jgi:hypothetical protein